MYAVFVVVTLLAVDSMIIGSVEAGPSLNLVSFYIYVALSGALVIAAVVVVIFREKLVKDPLNR